MPLSEHVYCVAMACKMTEWVEQKICIKFCVKLQYSSTETIQTINEIQENMMGQLMALKKLCELPRCLFKGYWGVIFLCRVFLVSSIFFSKCLYFSYYMAGYLLDRPRISFPFKKHESEHTDLLVPWHVCFVLFSTHVLLPLWLGFPIGKHWLDICSASALMKEWQCEFQLDLVPVEEECC